MYTISPTAVKLTFRSWDWRANRAAAAAARLRPAAPPPPDAPPTAPSPATSSAQITCKHWKAERTKTGLWNKNLYISLMVWKNILYGIYLWWSAMAATICKSWGYAADRAWPCECNSCETHSNWRWRTSACCIELREPKGSTKRTSNFYKEKDKHLKLVQK